MQYKAVHGVLCCGENAFCRQLASGCHFEFVLEFVCGGVYFLCSGNKKMQCLQMRLKSDGRLGIVAPAEQYRQRRYGAAAEVRKARPDFRQATAAHTNGTNATFS